MIVDVTRFGARGDGVHDDAEAILAACTRAAQIARECYPSPSAETFADVPPSDKDALWRAWLERADDQLWNTLGYPVRVHFPAGRYLMCRPLPVRVCFMGLTGDSLGRGHSASMILAAHDGPAVHLGDWGHNMTVIDGLSIRRIQSKWYTGPGILVDGADWRRGLTIRRSDISAHQGGIVIRPGGTFANLLVDDCRITQNHLAGVITEDGTHLTDGVIRDSMITQNEVGIRISVKGFRIEGNDLEGQEEPLYVGGTNCGGLTIGPNYFEATTESPCIRLGLVHGFRLSPQQFSSNFGDNKPVYFGGHCEGVCEVPQSKCDLGPWPETNKITFTVEDPYVAG